jgi:hypothetical protein
VALLAKTATQPEKSEILPIASALDRSLTQSELEQLLDASGGEMLRLIYQGYLDERGPGAVTEPVVDPSGKEHTQRTPDERSYTITIVAPINFGCDVSR